MINEMLFIYLFLGWTRVGTFEAFLGQRTNVKKAKESWDPPIRPLGLFFFVVIGISLFGDAINIHIGASSSSSSSKNNSLSVILLHRINSGCLEYYDQNSVMEILFHANRVSGDNFSDAAFLLTIGDINLGHMDPPVYTYIYIRGEINTLSVLKLSDTGHACTEK